MNTKFEGFKELTNYDMIDTYYDAIKSFKYLISDLQEDRVESQKYIVRANKEIERLNNIINEIEAIVYADISNIDCRISIQEKLDKIKELKESGNNE